MSIKLLERRRRLFLSAAETNGRQSTGHTMWIVNQRSGHQADNCPAATVVGPPGTCLLFFLFLLLPAEGAARALSNRKTPPSLCLFTPSPHAPPAEETSLLACGHGLTCGQISVRRFHASAGGVVVSFPSIRVLLCYCELLLRLPRVGDGAKFKTGEETLSST